MRIFKVIFWLCWRIWFYILMAIPIVIMFPFLLASIITENGYPYFFKMARIWAKCILFGMGFRYTVVQEAVLEPKTSYMIVANHTSMVDIMLMLAIVKNPFVFVGKQELAKIPLFGFFYKRTCILVDRRSAKSRHQVFEAAQQRINRGLSVCIFPEGGVPDDETVVLDSFKDGAFRLAVAHQIPIVPITFPDNKKRFSFTFFSGSPGNMRAYVHQIMATNGLGQESKKSIKEEVHQIILNKLLHFED